MKRFLGPALMLLSGLPAIAQSVPAEPLIACPVLQEGPLAPLRDVALSESGDWTLSLSGQVRARWESWQNAGFNSANDDDYLQGRLLLGADLKYRDTLRLFVQGKSADSTDRDLPGGRRTLEVDTLDLQNAFLDIMWDAGGAGKFLVRPGRQELSYGKQRLISPLDWANTRRTFDGGLARMDRGDWRVDMFWTRPVVIEKYEFNKPDSDVDFFGAYLSGKPAGGPLVVDAYWLGRERDGSQTEGAAPRERRYTVGGRMESPLGDTGLDAELELGWQYGDLGDRDIRASFVAAQVGYKASSLPWNPRTYVGFDYASGDTDPEDGRSETFDPLYPLGHAYLGYVDLVGRKNVIDYSTGVSVTPHAAVRFNADLHHFRRASTDDALYNAGNAVVRDGAAGDSREVGTELDLTVHVKMTPRTSALLGYSHFWAGSFIRESGPDSDVDFFYVSVQQEL